MLIIGLVLLVVAVIAFVIDSYTRSDGWGYLGGFAITFGIVLFLIGGIWALVVYYDTYPKLEAFYDSNLDNYRVIVERQNEIAVMDLKGPTEGEFFDGGDFAQSKETSNRYREYRDAANEYNLMLARYRRQGGTFLFWPMPQPDSRLKPIKIK